MTDEITITKTDDHYTMAFDGGSSYPVPTNAIDKLDDEITGELEDEGDTVSFRGEYGGHKHAKTFTVEEFDDEGGENDEQADAESGDDVSVADLAVGDRVENPSQRRGKEYEVVDIREEQTFDGTETVFAVKRVAQHGDLTGTADVIYETDHENWRVA